MAINPVNFIVSPSATATNGSDTITVTGSVDCSRVFAGTAVFIGTRHVVEALSGTVPDGSGNSTIKLKENWTDPTTTAVLTAMYTPEGLATAINYARDIVANISPIDGLVGTGLIEKTGVGTYSLLQKSTFEPVANLSSTSDTLPLAASQGQVLAGMISTKLDSSATAVNSLALGTVPAVDFRQKIDKIFDKAGTATIESSADDTTSSASFRAASGGAFISLHSINNFAFNFGYSTTQGKIGIGGWSLGNNFYEIYHSNNLANAQNLSGSTISSNATTAGSNLSPAQSGTWRNVSGNDILNNGYGLFKRD